jgi:hypothetical protein
MKYVGSTPDEIFLCDRGRIPGSYGPRGGNGGQRIGAAPPPHSIPMMPHSGSGAGSGRGDWDYEDMNAQVSHALAMGHGDGGGSGSGHDWDDDMGAPVARRRAERYRTANIGNSIQNWKVDTGSEHQGEEGDPLDSMDAVMGGVGGFTEFKDKYLTKKNILIASGVFAGLVAIGLVGSTMKKKPATA